MSDKLISRKINWDALGIVTSLACAIHCALLPLLLTSLPLFGINILNNFSFEMFMILLAFFIGAYSLVHGWKKHHHNRMPLTIFSAGILLLFIKQIFHEYQYWFLIPGVLLIVSAHFLNYRFCRVHDAAHAEDCVH